MSEFTRITKILTITKQSKIYIEFDLEEHIIRLDEIYIKEDEAEDSETELYKYLIEYLTKKIGCKLLYSMESKPAIYIESEKLTIVSNKNKPYRTFKFIKHDKVFYVVETVEDMEYIICGEDINNDFLYDLVGV